MSRTNDRRDRRDQDRVRYEEEDDELLTYERRRPAPSPPRAPSRERSPTPPGRRARGNGRVVEDEHIVRRERRYFDDREDIDSVILPAAARRRRPPPPPSDLPDDLASTVTSSIASRSGRRRDSPPRPGRLIRRQSSVETFDRRPARRAYELDRIDHDGRPLARAPVPLPIRHRRDSSTEQTERLSYFEEKREQDYDRGGRERRETTKMEELRAEPERSRYDSHDNRDDRDDQRRRDEEFETRQRTERNRYERIDRDGREEHDRLVETDRSDRVSFHEAPRDRPPRGGLEESRMVRERERRETVTKQPSVVSEGPGTELTRPRSRSRGVARSSAGDGGSKSEYPKKGKTRMPEKLVSEQVLIDLGYPFIKEGKTYILQVALGQDNIDDVLKLSRDYKKSQAEMLEFKRTETKLETPGGTVIGERIREKETFTAPAPPPAPAPAPARAPTPPPVAPQLTYYPQNPTQQVAQQIVYTSPPAPPPAPYVPAAEPYSMPVAVSPAPGQLSIQIRDVSPPPGFAPAYAPSPYSPVETAPVLYNAGSPTMDLARTAAHDPLALVALDSDHMRVRIRSKSRSRHRSTHRRHRSHSTHHSKRDGALYAHFHDSRDRDRDRDRYNIRVEDQYYYGGGDYYEPASTGRELMRTERLSTGEMVLYQDEVERYVEPPRSDVRIIKDRKGRMSISVPKNR
ncbi:hypothetical protein SEPCBS119000_002537 [Sporothrix epigloea]|uniref:DUF8035 domain-containing protein n=1 Tax=Sporothrix epigloea TaxID=1892477 RepID=A0ABP0DGP9_9PEZI